MTVSVLVADDQELVRTGLRAILDAQPDLEVVGEADNGRDAVTLAARLLPDVVVMDLRMPGVDGISATSRILAERPATRVLVLTTFGDDDHLYPALTAGVRRAAAGQSPFSQEVLRRLVKRAVHARVEAPRAVEGLTAREQDVLDLVAEGLSNTEIAERLHIGVTTVKTHITSLMTKTDSPNRVRLALYARGG